MILEPWPHLVIDEYYDPTLSKLMIKEIVTHIRDHVLTAKQTFYRSTDSSFQLQFPNTAKCAASVDPYKILTQFSEHRPYKSLSHYFEINVILDGHDYPIHDENPKKILSIVNYVAPEKSTGTLIYDTDKNYVGEIKWKQNRSLIFPGLTNKTWHAYRVEPQKLRITLNTFLIDDLA